MNTKYIVVDNTVRVTESNAFSVSDTLPLATYELCADDNGFFLKVIDDMSLMPKKIYGDTHNRVKRILSTFKTRKNLNTGIMLSGLKGSGKTLMTRLISIEAANTMNMATIVINSRFKSESLAQFLRSIKNPSVIVFDEFDKMFAGDDDDNSDTAANQNGLLSILDGVYTSNNLFVFSLNEVRKVNNYLISRPGRIYYHWRFGELGIDTVKDYCMDNLVNKKFTKDVCTISYLTNNFTFDILASIVNECNLYNESPFKFIDFFNIEICLNGSHSVEVVDVETGEVITKKDAYFNCNSGNDALTVGLPLYNDVYEGEVGRTEEYIKRTFPNYKKGDNYYGEDSSIRLASISYDMDDLYLNIQGKNHSMWDFLDEIKEDGTIISKKFLNNKLYARIVKNESNRSSAASFINEYGGSDVVDFAGTSLDERNVTNVKRVLGKN